MQPMPMTVNRQTVDLLGYPDLVVIYLGMRVNCLAGLKTLIGFGPKISDSVAAKPAGLLKHENLYYSLFPLHDSLLTWTRSEPHRAWWVNFLKDSGGTGFWHETYLMKGGMEAIYGDVPKPIGFMHFAPVSVARGPMFGAAHRAAHQYDEKAVVSEMDLYGPQSERK
jgi:hypothetical protein